MKFVGGPWSVVRCKDEPTDLPDVTNEPTGESAIATNEPTGESAIATNEPTDDIVNATNEPTGESAIATNEPTDACTNVTNIPPTTPQSLRTHRPVPGQM